tara:strand:+ start:192 stop:338 length:147 start_codon:yes stop_codon:yes gene_type:complete
MSEGERPSIQIPLPSEEDYRLYEEWIRKKEQEEKELLDKNRGVIIIDI